MKTLLTALLFAPLLMSCQENRPIVAKIAQTPTTFCNPLNLNYRFMKIEGGEGIREAADPVVVPFKDEYYLFASKSSGYWHSPDFVNWKHVFIPDSVLPIEDYAPGLFVHNDHVYYVGSTHGTAMLYRSAHPETGQWEKVKEIWSYWDPAFYVEGDNLYMYYGCSPADPIHAQVLNLNTLEARTQVIDCFNSEKETKGWERTGELNELPRRPYIEGAWMTAHNGKYYLQYAGPGTEWKSYADGVYTADSPMGPFTYAENSPTSYKPTGFTGGAGHGCLFTVGDTYWKAATNAISLRHMFERRLSFYPSGFDADGYLYTDTYLGDYPMFLPAADAPAQTVAGASANSTGRPGWMLLSSKKKVTASSSLDGYPAANVVDEEARTAWVAATNGNSEWLEVDLGDNASIQAIQVNYDEYGATQKGFVDGIYQSYRISASRNGKDWYTIVDNTAKTTDTPHDYIEFEAPFEARYIKWENSAYTVSSNVSLRELRVFGKGQGAAPQPLSDFSVTRDTTDPCKASLSWAAVEDADGYIIRYGTAKDKLYNNFQVMDSTSLNIGSLNSGVGYYFAIDTYNENGITSALQLKTIE